MKRKVTGFGKKLLSLGIAAAVALPLIACGSKNDGGG